MSFNGEGTAKKILGQACFQEERNERKTKFVVKVALTFQKKLFYLHQK